MCHKNNILKIHPIWKAHLKNKNKKKKINHKSRLVHSKIRGEDQYINKFDLIVFGCVIQKYKYMIALASVFDPVIGGSPIGIDK